jgi:hypothetical protein
MKRQPTIRADAHERFRKETSDLWPLAKGTLAEIRKPCIRAGCKACLSGKRHPALIYMFMENGRQRCMYVPRVLAAQLRQAIANGRQLETRLSQLGREIICGYRLERDYKRQRKQ